MRVELSEPPSAQSPFARGGCYPPRGDFQSRFRGHYSSFLAPTGSCVRPHPSQRLGGPSYAGSSQVVASPCWEMALPDIISAILAQALGPIPRRVSRVHLPSPSSRAPASRHGNAFGTRKCPCNATSTGSRISGLQSFDYLQAPTLARPPDCIHRSTFVRGGRAVYTTHRPGGYPFRDVASLRVRLGQLTRLDLHPLDCSLVGCSFPHTASQWSLKSPHYANIGVTAASRGHLTDRGPHLRHGTPRRPALERVDASPRPLPDSTAPAFAQMAAEKVDALAPVREVDHPRLLRMQPKPEPGQHQANPASRFLNRYLCVADDALRFGRKPYEAARKSASKMGSSTSVTAI